MSGKIILTRESTLLNYTARKFLVIVDGAHVCDVKNGQTVQIGVEPGEHTVVVKIDYHTSNKVTVLVPDGGQAVLICTLANGAVGMLKSFSPRGYVQLRAVDPSQAVVIAPGNEQDSQQPQPPPPDSNSPRQGSIFISYRRADTEHVTGRIYDHLTSRFGQKPVFKDVDSIPLGVDFRDHLKQSLSSCEVALVVVGDQWETLTGPDGVPRLTEPADHVRIEIELALEREIPVVPLMVRRNRMPDPDELPESIRSFSFRNGIPIRPDPDFKHDIDRLIESLAEVVES